MPLSFSEESAFVSASASSTIASTNELTYKHSNFRLECDDSHLLVLREGFVKYFYIAEEADQL